MPTTWLLHCGAILALISPALSARAAKPARDHVALLQVREYHGNEVDAVTGEEMFGLYATRSGFELRPARIRVQAVDDPILGSKAGKRVSLGDSATPIVLIGGPARFRTGAVPCSFFGHKYLRPRETMGLKLPGFGYGFEAKGGYEAGRPAGDQVVGGYELWIFEVPGGRGYHEVTKQRLGVPSRFAEDGTPQLLWAGDLDRDGRLDLLMDLTDHYNVSDLTLFLSSRAGRGEIVRRVAHLRTTGC